MHGFTAQLHKLKASSQDSPVHQSIQLVFLGNASQIGVTVLPQARRQEKGHYLDL